MICCAVPWIQLFGILAQIPGQQGAPEPIPCAEDMPCPDPDGQVCLVGQCHDGIAPVLEIVTPAQYESASWTPGGETTDLSVTIRVKGFQIVDPAIDPTNVRTISSAMNEKLTI